MMLLGKRTKGQKDKRTKGGDGLLVNAGDLDFANKSRLFVNYIYDNPRTYYTHVH